jgi:hypothetical protein
VYIMCGVYVCVYSESGHFAGEMDVSVGGGVCNVYVYHVRSRR